MKLAIAKKSLPGPKNHKVLTCLLLLLAANYALAQDWPQWRGPNRDNKVTGFTPPRNWPKELTQKWQVKVGRGESSPVLVGDKLYVFGLQDKEEVTLCLDAATGKEIWRDKYPTVTVNKFAQAHPGPRSSPAVAEGKVCTLGVGGMVSCLDAATGKPVWRKDTKSFPLFNTSTSPLILDGKCIVFVNGLTAFDLVSGEAKWQWTGAKAPYGSPVLLTIDGTKQIVTPTAGFTIVGIGAADGRLLWSTPFGSSGYDDNMATPIIDGQTVICAGSKAGTVAVKIEKDGAGFAAKPLWKNTKKTDLVHKYMTPVLRDGALYGMTNGKNFICIDAKTGDKLWLDESAKRGDCGHILDAGSVLLALTNDSYLVAFEPSTKEYKELAKYKVADAAGANGPWSCPIIAGNRVYVKAFDTLTLWTIE